MNPADRVFDILEVFLEAANGMKLREIAHAAGQNPSTVYRVVSTLVRRGYLRQEQNRGEYNLGPRFLKFLYAVKRRNEVIEISYPFLIRINQAAGESVNLAIRDAYDAIYVEHLESSHSLRMFTQTGHTVPLHCTGVGKVILADMTQPEFNRFLEIKGLPRYTKNTITNPKQLKNVLARVCLDGFATDDQEMELGVRCIAAPVRDFDGTLAGAISISGPSVRVNIDDQRIEFLIKDYALEISRALGYRG